MNRHNTENLRELLEKIERLEAENRDMREALEFYAEISSWYINGAPQLLNHIVDEDLEEVDEPQPLSSQMGTFCGGRRAREVLAKWGKK
jgi:hypothetical protein